MKKTVRLVMKTRTILLLIPINTTLMLSLAPLFATKTFITTFIKTPSCSSSVTNTFCFFRRGRLRSAHTIQRTRDEGFFSMGALVSRDGTNSSSNTKTNYSFTNEKKRQRGGGKKKTLTTEKTIVSAAAQASKSNDNDDNENDDELLKTPTKKKKTKKTTNNVKHERAPPKNWEECLAKIKQMRKNGPLAPVDTMGCEKIAETSDEKQKRYRTLISAMLSSQTKDQINHATMNKLIALNKDTAEGILNTTEDDLDEIIHQVGFHRNKAKYLRAAAKICVEKYGGDIPPDLESLVELPGVGPKMGHLIMNVGWEKPSGICVDVHVHRITERLGWVSESCAVTNAGSPRKRTPEDTRVALENWLPKDEWVEINPLLVGFGQLYCTPLRPKCSECDVADLCQNAFRDAATPTKKKNNLKSSKN